MAEIKVGDEVRVYDGHQRYWPGKVVRKGRTLVDIKSRLGIFAFRLDTRLVNGPQPGYCPRFLTLEEAEPVERRANADKALRDHGINLALGHKLSLEQVEALADLVRSFDLET